MVPQGAGTPTAARSQRQVRGGLEALMGEDVVDPSSREDEQAGTGVGSYSTLFVRRKRLTSTLLQCAASCTPSSAPGMVTGARIKNSVPAGRFKLMPMCWAQSPTGQAESPV